jgi:hypothetical protein
MASGAAIILKAPVGCMFAGTSLRVGDWNFVSLLTPGHPKNIAARTEEPAYQERVPSYSTCYQPNFGNHTVSRVLHSLLESLSPALRVGE